MSGILQRYQVSADPLRSERRTEAVLLGTGLLVLLLLIWGAFRAMVPGSLQPVVPTAESMQVAPLSGNTLVTLEDREEIRARPLFWVTRAPMGAQEVVAEAETQSEADKKAQAKPLKGVKLAGVFGGGETGGMIVLHKGKKHRVSVGGEFDGWTLDSVAPTEVVLTSAGSQATLALERGKPVASSVSQKDTAEAKSGSGAGGESEAAGKKNANAKKQGNNAAKKRAKPDGLSLGGGARGG